MSKSNAYFMERMETDESFRQEVELAEIRMFEPEFQPVEKPHEQPEPENETPF